jgi:non-ribosomal peptide synthetase component F
VDPPRELSQTPLFQVSFAAVDASARPSSGPGLDIRPVTVDTGYVTHDLQLTADLSGDGLALRLTGNADLFDKATLLAMLSRLTRLLTAATAAPNGRVHTLPILTDAERDRAIVEWNATRDDHPRDICFHELFERWAAAGPDAMALRCGDRDLTYGQLENRANRLAAELRNRGVGPEALVAIVADRSADAVVALLGVLKAGGAYVPIAPNSPVDRMRLVLADARPVVGIESPATAGLLGRAELELPVVPVPDDDGPVERVESGVRPENVAYVIYTSGSTGQPKGVAVEHRQLVASTAARWAYEDPKVDLLTLPLTFDAPSSSRPRTRRTTPASWPSSCAGSPSHTSTRCTRTTS